MKTVEADLAHSSQTVESWYTVHIQIEPEELAKIGNLSTLTGMSGKPTLRSATAALPDLIEPLSISRAMQEK